ncbi:MAG: class I mannose-6-phosphate isomerase [Verrucomicrobiae bacterium]|nr:class I mannose-6-phosphate isomerase [Verrucomicrobiae bacterium]
MRLQDANLLYPYRFQPIAVPRVWGGQALSRYGKPIPPNQPIGEVWEIADRPDAQSVVANGPMAGHTLRQLVEQFRQRLLGSQCADTFRFPLLIKLLDAQQRLSLQVHPPPDVARQLHSEPKTEMWYVLHAEPNAHIIAGLKRGTTRQQFEAALHSRSPADAISALLHRFPVKTGDAFFVPAGRLHAIDAGVILIEIQQNSDTTYRVFDWERVGLDGTPRPLHITESLASIDFTDHEPTPSPLPICCPHFRVELIELTVPRTDCCNGTTFQIIGCVIGQIEIGQQRIQPAEFVLLPASLGDYCVVPVLPASRYLKITLPNQH